MERFGVIGGGVMGSGISETIARAGYDVINVDKFELGITNAQKRIKKDMQYLLKRNKILKEDSRDIINRIKYSNEYEALEECDFVIEAVPESIELKQDIFKQIGQIVKPEAIIASNTSALSISSISVNTKNPERCIGMHFFHPAPVMKLIEITKSCSTNKSTLQRAQEIAKSIGKTPVISPETPGFIVNRLLVPMMNEAVFLVMEGSKPEDIDNAMRFGANHPMGPLELIDYTGVDVTYNTMIALYNGFKDSKYRPCPLLKNMIASGFLGRKSGKGFYNYNDK